MLVAHLANFTLNAEMLLVVLPLLPVARLRYVSGIAMQPNAAAQDDHATVRHAALETLVAILPDVPPAARATTLPALRSIFAKPPPNAKADPAAAAALAGAFAAPTPLPTSLLPLAATDAAMFLGAYCQLALHGPPAARLQCARGFPAMLLAMCPAGSPGLQRAPLLDTLLRLSVDPEVCSCVPAFPPRSSACFRARFESRKRCQFSHDDFLIVSASQQACACMEVLISQCRARMLPA